MAGPLYHFTCIDGHRRIGRVNCLLIPQRGLWPFLWLTTEPEPDFEASGLTRVITTCDRTEFRYVITDRTGCRPWLGSPERGLVGTGFLQALEEFGDKEHWWISAEPVRAQWDRSWRSPLPVSVPESVVSLPRLSSARAPRGTTADVGATNRRVLHIPG